MKTDCSRISPVSRLMKRDGDGQRTRVGEVLLAALLERGDGLVEGELAELHGEVAGVVLDRRDVVDRLAQPPLLRVGQPGEGLALDVDQVGDVNRVLSRRANVRRVRGASTAAKAATPREVGGTASGGACQTKWPEARPAKIAQGIDAPVKGRRRSRTPPSVSAYVARRPTWWAAATIGRRPGV